MKVIKYLPLFIITLISLKSFYNFSTTNLEYEFRHYAAFFLIGLALILLVIRKEKVSFYLTFLILTLSTFDLLRYSLITQKFRLGGMLNNVDVSIGIQTRSLLLLVLFVILNRDLLTKQSPKP